MDGETFGEALRRHRQRAKLTQTELARRAGLSNVTVGQLERGVWKTPRGDTAMLLADTLGLDAAERERFFQLIAEQRPSRVPAAFAGAPAPAPGPLFGRDADLARLAGLLEPGALVTLVGPGGIGKTRLAAEAARAFAGPVAWVAGEAFSDPADLVPAIARALGLADLPGEPDIPRIAAALRGRAALLVLDNLEHLLAAAPAIAELHRAAADTTLLCTSRETLRIQGERVVPVDPLPVPLPEDRANPDDLLANPAVRLFLQRGADYGHGHGHGHGHGAGPAGDRGDLADVARIVTALDGMPLAIQLAASQAGTLPPAAIADLLERAGLAMLSAGAAEAPDRHRTMEAAIAWSVDMLPEPARRLLPVLGAFRGGFTAEALAGVADALGEPALPAGLPALANAHLVRAVPMSGPGARFAMLEPIRLYAVDRLRESGREREARLAHARWFLGWARRQAQVIAGPDPLPALDAVQADLANLREAIAAGAALGEVRDALGAAAELRRFWENRGFIRDGAAALDAALAAAGDDPALSPELPEALFWRGYVAGMQGDQAASARLTRRLRDLAAAAGAQEFIARAALNEWRDLHADPATAADAREALARGRAAVADPDGFAAWALTHLAGFDLLETGDAAGALPFIEESERIVRASGCALDLPLPLTLKGLALLALGRDAEARATFEESVRTALPLGTGMLLPGSLLGLAALEARSPDRADVERAARRLGAVDGIARRAGFAYDDRAFLGVFASGVMAETRDRISAALGEARRQELEAEGAEMSLAEAGGGRKA